MTRPSLMHVTRLTAAVCVVVLVSGWGTSLLLWSRQAASYERGVLFGAMYTHCVDRLPSGWLRTYVWQTSQQPATCEAYQRLRWLEQRRAEQFTREQDQQGEHP